MNFVQHLEQENEDLRRKLSRAEHEICKHRKFLWLIKFLAKNNEGMSSDWICSSDIDVMLRDVYRLCRSRRKNLASRGLTERAICSEMTPGKVHFGRGRLVFK